MPENMQPANENKIADNFFFIIAPKEKFLSKTRFKVARRSEDISPHHDARKYGTAELCFLLIHTRDFTGPQ